MHLFIKFLQSPISQILLWALYNKIISSSELFHSVRKSILNLNWKWHICFLALTLLYRRNAINHTEISKVINMFPFSQSLSQYKQYYKNYFLYAWQYMERPFFLDRHGSYRNEIFNHNISLLSNLGYKFNESLESMLSGEIWKVSKSLPDKPLLKQSDLLHVL